MRWRIRSIVAVLGLLGTLFCSSDLSAADNRQQDEQDIRATAKQYVEALERGDAKTLAGFWLPDGDIVDELGVSHPAREVMELEAKAAGEGARPEVKITGGSIRFLTPNVALEEGTSEVRRAGGKPQQGRFTAVWVKQDGNWRLATLREARLPAASPQANLEDLDWMAGEFTGKTKDNEIEVVSHWNSTHRYLIRQLNIIKDGKVVFGGTQRIGWDPLTRQIKSWTFDSDGGHGEGVWTKDGDSWVVQAQGVLPDGRQTSSTNVYRKTEGDGLSWKSTDARTNGEPIADLDIEFVRKPAAK